MGDSEIERLGTLMAEARRLARPDNKLTGRPLWISGEVAEYEAARLLDLELCPARQAGHDAIGRGERVMSRSEKEWGFFVFGDRLTMTVVRLIFPRIPSAAAL